MDEKTWEGIVEREKRRLWKLARPMGASLEDVAVNKKDGRAVLFVRSLHGRKLVRNYVPDGEIVRQEGGRMVPVANVRFLMPRLVAMVKEDGTVIRGAPEEVRQTAEAWLGEEIMETYLQTVQRTAEMVAEATCEALEG